VQLWDCRPRSNRLPASTNHTDIVVWVRFNPGRTLVAGGWEKSVRRWDVATHLARAVLVQPIFEAVPRSELSGAGRSTVRKKAAGKKAATTGQAMK
jgi:WD40 repeat protein